MTEKQVKYNFRKVKDGGYLLGGVFITNIEFLFWEFKHILKFIIMLPKKELLKKDSTDFWYSSDTIVKYCAKQVKSDKINVLKWLRSNWSKIEESIKDNDKKFYKKYLKYRDYDRKANTI